MKKVTKENCLETARPDLAKQWNQEKNGKLTPSNVTKSSGRKVWWECSYGHIWEAVVASRSLLKNNCNCPYCAGKKVCHDNCLATTHSYLLKEWDYEKNTISPLNVTYGSGKSIWWKCKKGHSWKVRCSTRTNMNSGCPFCSGRCPSINNNLSTIYPNLLKEWSPKNTISPLDIAPKSGKKVWWKCKSGHEWEASLSSRNGGKSGCPYCSSFDNSLQNNNPDISREWHPSLNGKITPLSVAAHSPRKVWWQCSLSPCHIWEARISSRTRRQSLGGNGCPYCSHHKAGKDNNIAVTKPFLVKEWHPTKNGSVKPSEVCGGKKKYWWKCQKNHEWEATLDHRIRGRGCPICSHRKVVLDDGEKCDSHVEAYAYLKFREQGVEFIHDKLYGHGMGRKRYDFFFPSLKKYVEVTSYNDGWKHWNKYIKRIEEKRAFVTQKGCVFELLIITMSPEKFQFVRRHLFH